MSYTHAYVSWEVCSRLNDSIINKYGDIVHLKESSTEVMDSNANSIHMVFKTPVQILARKQPHSEVVDDGNGKTYLTKNIYYVDPGIEPNAFKIQKYDRLDGELIINVYEMHTLFNKVRMIRFTTI